MILFCSVVVFGLLEKKGGSVDSGVQLLLGALVLLIGGFLAVMGSI